MKPEAFRALREWGQMGQHPVEYRALALQACAEIDRLNAALKAALDEIARLQAGGPPRGLVEDFAAEFGSRG